MSTENNSQGFVINNRFKATMLPYFLYFFLSFQPMTHKTYAWKITCNDLQIMMYRLYNHLWLRQRRHLHRILLPMYNSLFPRRPFLLIYFSSAFYKLCMKLVRLERFTWTGELYSEKMSGTDRDVNTSLGQWTKV